MHKTLLIFTCSLFFVFSCTQENNKDVIEFVESIKIQGNCNESHVDIHGEYTGNLVHWFNKTKNENYRYGSVHNFNSLKADKIIDSIQNPLLYRVPLTVTFDDIPEDVFSENHMVLHGVSEHSPTSNGVKGASYKATCKLTVISRNDTPPSKG